MGAATVICSSSRVPSDSNCPMPRPRFAWSRRFRGWNGLGKGAVAFGHSGRVWPQADNPDSAVDRAVVPFAPMAIGASVDPLLIKRLHRDGSKYCVAWRADNIRGPEQADVRGVEGDPASDGSRECEGNDRDRAS